MLETVVSFTGDPATQATVDIIARSFVDRFGQQYERYVADGGTPFAAGVWYRLEVTGITPTVRIIVAVELPVYGLGLFVSSLAAQVAETFAWHFDIGTSVVLRDELDVGELEAAGWRMLDFPPASPPVEFSTVPPAAMGQLTAFE